MFTIIFTVNNRLLFYAEEIMNNTKENILESALELFSVAGYDAVSVSDISGKVGITKGALYKHYENKRDIFDSIVKKMTETDKKRAEEYSMPEDLYENDAEAYRRSSVEKLCEYTKAQFVYWTTDPFASHFRRLISVERYKDPEMGKLYTQCFSSGPLLYVKDIFKGVFEEKKESYAFQLALKFYSPMYLFYDIYDETENKDEVIDSFNGYVDRFAKQLEKHLT